MGASEPDRAAFITTPSLNRSAQRPRTTHQRNQRPKHITTPQRKPRLQLVIPSNTPTFPPSANPNPRDAVTETPPQSRLTQPDYANLPPGTTSLLVRIPGTDAQDITRFLREWLSDYVFSSTASISTPVSIDYNDATATEKAANGTRLLFYASQNEVRGVLTLSAEPAKKSQPSDVPNDVIVRVTSSSRFINPAGTYAATLPGERRLIRNLYTRLSSQYATEILFKPPFIRLRAPKRNTDSSAAVTAFVGEIRRVRSTSDVKQFLRRWANEMQFGTRSSGGIFGARMPPLSTEVMEGGVRVRFGVDGIVEATVRRRSTGGKIFAKSEREERKEGKAIVVVSATNGGDAGCRAILKT